jgi:hypothetical protein
MQVTRNRIETMVGPRQWFMGAVSVDAVAAPSGASRLSRSVWCHGPAPGDQAARARGMREA